MRKQENVKSELNKEADINTVEPILPELAKRDLKPTKLDNAIALVVKSKGLTNKAEISKEIIGMGLTKYAESVYRRLAKSSYLKAEIGIIRDNNRQTLDRVIVPDALKIMHKAIKLKTLSDDDKALYKAKEPYVGLAIKHSFGEIRHVEQAQTINITSINNAQFNIKDDVA